MDLRETISRAHIIPILVISTFVMFLKPIPVSGQGASARRQTAEPARQECVEGVGRVHAAWTLLRGSSAERPTPEIHLFGGLGQKPHFVWGVHKAPEFYLVTKDALLIRT